MTRGTAASAVTRIAHPRATRKPSTCRRAVHRSQDEPIQPKQRIRLLGATLVKQNQFPKGYRLFTLTRPAQAQAGTLPDDIESDIESKFSGGIIKGVHHVALICESLDHSLHFYTDVLGLTVNPDRPDEKLPYRGAWLNLGPEMIHLMELPNPDKGMTRPEHGGRDRHFCFGIEPGTLQTLTARLDDEGITYTLSRSGRPAIFFRDPDENCLEAVEIVDDWR